MERGYLRDGAISLRLLPNMCVPLYLLKLQSENTVRSKNWAKTLHKYIGIPLCLLLFLAGLSGILLNHRDALKRINVPPSLLPEDYQYHNWNRASLRSALRYGSNHYLYGNAGVYLTKDSNLRTEPIPYNEGLGIGGDERKVVAMASDKLGRVWLATQYALYRDNFGRGWELIARPQGKGERLNDLQIRGDSLVLLSRSHIYSRTLRGRGAWHRYTLPRAERHEEGLLLFQLVWALHSGEYFGRLGQFVVDVLGLLLMFISLVGLYYTVCRKGLSWAMKSKENRARLKPWGQRQIWAYRWHARLGRRLFWALLFVCMTGWVLRPPLMLGLLHHRLVPWRISHLYSENPWQERLRALRYDALQGVWLLHTTTGFYQLSTWDEQPKAWKAQPYISPMGINVWEQRGGTWVVGSLAGMYRVDSGGRVHNYFSDEPIVKYNRMPFGEMPIAGAILGLSQEEDILFDYNRGAIHLTDLRTHTYGLHLGFAPQPAALREAPFSLWQWAVELHTGRIYAPLIGRWGSLLFIFPFGLLVLIVFVTGYRRMPRRRWL